MTETASALLNRKVRRTKGFLPKYFTLKVALENKSSFFPSKKLQINSVITYGIIRKRMNMIRKHMSDEIS